MGGVSKFLTRSEKFQVRQPNGGLLNNECPHTKGVMVGSCTCAKCVYHEETIFKQYRAVSVICNYNKSNA